MNNSQFKKAISQLNDEQYKAFDLIVSHFHHKRLYDQGQSTEKPNPLFLLLTGAGGTGKSFPKSVINDYLPRAPYEINISVIKTAPTGVAAFNIWEDTLHGAFYLPVTHEIKRLMITLALA